MADLPITAVIRNAKVHGAGRVGTDAAEILTKKLRSISENRPGKRLNSHPLQEEKTIREEDVLMAFQKN